MIKEVIKKLVNKQNLSEKETYDVMNEIMSGQATQSQIASFLTALNMKGETIDEITGSVKSMRKFCNKVEHKFDIIIDTCGTGGDVLHTFNISTLTAFVVASADIPVAKHGNRSVSSKCGSADLIEGFGIKLELDSNQAFKCLSETGFVFLFAPMFHPAMKYAIGPRKEIGIKSIFNIIGPLCNPCFVTRQLIGVYDESLLKIVPQVLKNFDVQHAFVVRSDDGMDEISLSDNTKIAELKNGEIKYFEIIPKKYGFKKVNLEELRGGDVSENIKITQDILNGEKGAKRDIVLLNAGAALFVADKVKDIKEGIELAEDLIDSGKVLKKLQQLIEFSKKI